MNSMPENVMRMVKRILILPSEALASNDTEGLRNE